MCCMELVDTKASSGWGTAAFALLLVRLILQGFRWNSSHRPCFGVDLCMDHSPLGVYLLQRGLIHLIQGVPSLVWPFTYSHRHFEDTKKCKSRFTVPCCFVLEKREGREEREFFFSCVFYQMFLVREVSVQRLN